MRRVIGGWQAATPLQEGLEDEAHSSTAQPHSLAEAGEGNTAAVRNIPTVMDVALAGMATFIKHTNS